MYNKNKKLVKESTHVLISIISALVFSLFIFLEYSTNVSITFSIVTYIFIWILIADRKRRKEEK